VSRPDPSGADQIDAEHQPTDLATNASYGAASQPTAVRSLGQSARLARPEPAVGDRDASKDCQERQRRAARAATVLVGLANGLGRRASRTAQVLLGSAVAALAVPAAVRSAEALPAVKSESASPGLGHRGLLGSEP
jgi:hypothetical protein